MRRGGLRATSRSTTGDTHADGDTRVRLLRFTPPRATPSLRERVLTRGREAAAASRAPTTTDRIWFSARWRAAWAAALALAVLLEAAAARSAAASGAGGAAATAALRIQREGDLAAAELGLSGRTWAGGEAVSDREAMFRPREVMP